MSTDIPYVNDWHRLETLIGKEHHHILQSTLPTPSFKALLTAQIQDCEQRLIGLDLSREPIEFKDKYRSIRLQQDLAASLLEYVKSFSALN